MRDEITKSNVSKKDIYVDFRKHFIQYNLKPARFFAIFAGLLYFSFYLFDAYLTGLVQSNIYQWRIIFSISIGLLISLTHVSWLKIYWQILFVLFLITAGIGVIVMSFTFDNDQVRAMYSQGLLIIIFYSYTMSRLMVGPAIVSGLSITILYTLICFYNGDLNHSFFIVNISLQVVSNVFGIIIAISNQNLLLQEFILKSNAVKQSNKITELNKDLILLNKKINDFANTDGLTEVSNRRWFNEKLEETIKISKREFSQFSLILLDIDFFKNYNDYYGDIKGDDCLKRIAIILRDCIKGTYGTVARYGGKEFAIIIPNINQKATLRKVENMMFEIKQAKIINNKSSVSKIVTVSIGVITVNNVNQFMTNDKILKYADTCLYKAREQGRNQYVYLQI